MEDRRPAEVFPPGQYIKEELEARGWTQTDLAEILGRPLRVVNEIIAAKRSISPETATGLGEAFDTSAQVWLNLESAYQLSKVRHDDDGGVARRARLYSKAPIKDMVRRRWIEASDKSEVLEKRLLDFFEIKSLDEEPAFWAQVARKSTTYRAMTSAQTAWLFRAKQIAWTIPAEPYSPERLNEALERLRVLLSGVDEIGLVPGILADAGIRFLVIEALPQTRIDGACFWLDKTSPVVVLSLRFDRIDYFWFTLMHELSHVRRGDGMNNAPLDTDLVGANAQEAKDKPDFEKVADQLAVATLIRQDVFQDFVRRTRPLYSKRKISEFASRIGAHPGIVVGQLQYIREINYSSNREMIVKVRDVVLRSAVADGWGYALAG